MYHISLYERMSQCTFQRGVDIFRHKKCFEKKIEFSPVIVGRKKIICDDYLKILPLK
jgi:hypothetical protein